MCCIGCVLKGKYFSATQISHTIGSIYSDAIHAANIMLMQKDRISMIQTMQISLKNTAVLPVQFLYESVINKLKCLTQSVCACEWKVNRELCNPEWDDVEWWPDGGLPSSAILPQGSELCIICSQWPLHHKTLVIPRLFNQISELMAGDALLLFVPDQMNMPKHMLRDEKP